MGCGVGYFSLKLAPIVAEHGSVLAEDTLTKSLTFLWIRAFLNNHSNIREIHGELDDPYLPKGGVVLIANSYHEFAKPLPILDAKVLEYVRSSPNSETQLGLLRFAQFGFGAILGKEFPDIPPHDLVTGRAQMNMIIYKQVQDRFMVLPEHVVKDVDIVCLGLGFQEILHQLIKFEDIPQENQPGRARFYRNKSDRDEWRIATENPEQFLE